MHRNSHLNDARKLMPNILMSCEKLNISLLPTGDKQQGIALPESVREDKVAHLYNYHRSREMPGKGSLAPWDDLKPTSTCAETRPRSCICRRPA